MHVDRRPAAPRPKTCSRGRALFAALGVLLLLTACGAVEDAPESPTAPPATPETSSPDTDSNTDAATEPDADAEPGAEARPEPADDPDPDVGAQPQVQADPEPTGPPVTIAFGGDVMFEGMIRGQLDADPEGLLTPVAPVFAAADLTVVNLETAITEGGDPGPKQYTFRAPPTALQALRSAGVDVASLANNHGMDYGQSGLQDTLAAAEELDFPLIGVGRDVDEAFAPYTTSIRGREIAVIGATQVMDSVFFDSWPATEDRAGLASAKHEHEADLLAAVDAARDRADTVVVFLHWGVEGQACPSEDQAGLAQRLAEAGADIVVGSHAHRLLGTGMLGDTLVDYGLGNFVFYSQQSPGIDTGVLLVTAEGPEILDYEWVPARIQQGVPHPLEGDQATAAVAAWDELRTCTGLSES